VAGLIFPLAEGDLADVRGERFRVGDGAEAGQGGGAEVNFKGGEEGVEEDGGLQAEAAGNETEVEDGAARADEVGGDGDLEGDFDREVAEGHRVWKDGWGCGGWRCWRGGVG